MFSEGPIMMSTRSLPGNSCAAVMLVYLPDVQRIQWREPQAPTYRLKVSAKVSECLVD